LGRRESALLTLATCARAAAPSPSPPLKSRWQLAANNDVTSHNVAVMLVRSEHRSI
jgi:hypothetical protein